MYSEPLASFLLSFFHVRFRQLLATCHHWKRLYKMVRGLPAGDDCAGYRVLQLLVNSSSALFAE